MGDCCNISDILEKRAGEKVEAFRQKLQDLRPLWPSEENYGKAITIFYQVDGGCKAFCGFPATYRKFSQLRDEAIGHVKRLEPASMRQIVVVETFSQVRRSDGVRGHLETKAAYRTQRV